MVEKKHPQCAKCEVVRCFYPNRKEKPPANCPMMLYPDVLRGAVKKSWSEHEARKINLATEKTLYDAYDLAGNPKWTRIRELIEFSKKLGVKKLGLAFCVGLHEEAKLFSNILEKNGFEVVSIGCMAGGIPRHEIGIEMEIGIEEWGPFFKNVPFCSPITQAEVLNHERTELNILFGLCVGHDILFIKHSNAYVTPLVVKDRVTGHNPIAAIYATIADLKPPEKYTYGYYTTKLFPPLTLKVEAEILREKIKDRREEIRKMEERLNDLGCRIRE